MNYFWNFEPIFTKYHLKYFYFYILPLQSLFCVLIQIECRSLKHFEILFGTQMSLNPYKWREEINWLFNMSNTTICVRTNRYTKRTRKKRRNLHQHWVRRIESNPLTIYFETKHRSYNKSYKKQIFLLNFLNLNINRPR